MSTNLSRTIITKKIIDLFVNFLKDEFSQNRLYQTVKITDRFPLEVQKVFSIIVKSATNTHQRVDFTDFIEGISSRVELIPISCDTNLVGNNIQRANLPQTINWNPIQPFDISIPLPSGYDINEVILTSGTNYNNTDYTTGIIITVPSGINFKPSSLVYGAELVNPPNVPSPILSGSQYNLAIGLDTNAQQFYLMYSGNGFSGVNSLPIQKDQYIINPSGMQSGAAIKLNSDLFPGDQYQLNFYPTPQYIADRFGGIYKTTISFECCGETTIEAEDLADITEDFLVRRKSELYNLAGVNMLTWSNNGQSEEPHLNGYYFKSTISADCFVEWFSIVGNNLISGITNQIVPVGCYWMDIPFSGSSGWNYFNSISGNQLSYFSGVSATTLIDPSGVYALPNNLYIKPGIESITIGNNSVIPFINYGLFVSGNTTQTNNGIIV